MTAISLLLATFVASAVEAVEAFTIVLALGVTRGWRSTLLGVAAALAVLAVIVAVLGPAVTSIPIGWLRVVVGGLLLVFGLQWLRKAILGPAGTRRCTTRRRRSRRSGPPRRRHPVPTPASIPTRFTVAFKGVLLEGLEVAFIVVTFGANHGSVPLAVVGALAAIVVVVVAGIALRAPLAAVPENTLKFAVGLLLTTFGTFWAAEGAGVDWPGGDAALLVLLAFYTAVALGLVRLITAQPTAAAS